MTILQHNYNNFLIQQSSSDALLAGRLIPKGWVNATAMCKANGKTWSNYWKTKKAKSFADKVSTALLNGSPATITIEGGNDKDIQGTWVHLKIAMHLAIEISDDFALWATDVLLRVVNGEYKALTEDAEKALKKLNELWDLIRQHGKETRNNLTDSIKDYLLRHPEKSDDYKRWIYANATNAMYNAVFGMNAIELEEFLTCSRNKSRDHLDTKCLDKIDRVEAAICDLINDQDIEPTQAVSEYIRFMKVKPMFPNKKLEPCDFN